RAADEASAPLYYHRPRRHSTPGSDAAPRGTPSGNPAAGSTVAVTLRGRRASVEKRPARRPVVEVDLSVRLDAAVERLPARPVRGSELDTRRNGHEKASPRDAQVLSLRRYLDPCDARWPGLEADLVDAARRPVPVLIGEADAGNRAPAGLAVAVSASRRIGRDHQGGV